MASAFCLYDPGIVSSRGVESLIFLSHERHEPFDIDFWFGDFGLSGDFMVRM